MIDPFEPLPKSFYLRDTRTVARDLLGRFITLKNNSEKTDIGNTGGEFAVRDNGLSADARSKDTKGPKALCTLLRIVETEAYLRNDPASHSFRGQTKRNASMFLEGGHAYVYRIYGIHRCLNAVTGPEGIGEAVLIRAVEPLEGIKKMWERRYGDKMPEEKLQNTANGLPDRRLRDVCNGPGKLCRALGINVGEYDGTDLSSGPLMILRGNPVEKDSVGQSVRIGLTKGKGEKQPWRFFIIENPFLSRR